MTQSPVPLPEAPEAPGDAHERPRILVRVGTVFFTGPREPLRSAEGRRIYAEELAAALIDDNRVSAVEDYAPNDEWIRYRTIHPDERRSSHAAIRVGRDSLTALHLDSAIRFTVSVPIKNQPAWHGEDDAPSDTYEAIWDGTTLVVAWQQDKEEVPFAGGHIVAEVLRDLATKVGGATYEQACSPSCQNLFLHHTLIVEETGQESRWTAYENINRFEGRIFAPPEVEPSEVARVTYSQIESGARAFAHAKNSGRRLLDLDHVAKDDLLHLLVHYHDHYRRVAFPKDWRDRIRALWPWWRREARALIAGLWVTMAGIQNAYADWKDSSRLLRAETSESGYGALFLPDFVADEENILGIDLSVLQGAVQDAAKRLDARSMSAATALGALSGAAAAAVVTAVLS